MRFYGLTVNFEMPTFFYHLSNIVIQYKASKLVFEGSGTLHSFDYITMSNDKTIILIIWWENEYSAPMRIEKIKILGAS